MFIITYKDDPKDIFHKCETFHDPEDFSTYFKLIGKDKVDVRIYRGELLSQTPPLDFAA